MTPGTDITGPLRERPEAPEPGAAPLAWHALEVAQVVQALDADPARGFGVEQVAKRARAWGPNELPSPGRRSVLRMLLEQFSDFMILVLLAAAVVAGALGDVSDTLTIVVIVVVNAVIGVAQEYRAERAMQALRTMAAATARVLRDGQRFVVPAAALVPGDVVDLEAGAIVPADLRLIEVARLRIDESALTGESVTVDKQTDPLATPDAVLADRCNMAYRGTAVAQGRGVGVVVATGGATELGRIATLLASTVEPKTPLQLRLTAFGRRMALVVIAICAVLFGVGLARGEPPVLMFLTAVSLAVAAIPEALPAVITILLALGARRMVRERALVRRLPAVETLGSVSCICSDKTGTLTQNRMSVQEMFVDGRVVRELGTAAASPALGALLSAIVLNNDAAIREDGATVGDPTEVALLASARGAGVHKDALEAEQPRVQELPFDSQRKRMTTVHAQGSGFLALTKGAPEAVLERCSRTLGEAGEAPVDRASLLAQAERMAAEGLRVLAIARRQWASAPPMHDPQALESDLVFIGLVGLIDPPRPQAREAVELCRTAGIDAVMITGDHPATARAIARRLGILDDAGEVMTGGELARLDDAVLLERVERVRVYARMDPAQKIRLVQALQARGRFVAMTGDGVNDAPALKRADIGVAMGRDGTDVAREASGLVLLDDNFSTIVAAVREGRRIFDNIRKFIRYAMTGNSAEIWTLFLAPLAGLPIPLLPIHILWVNLVTDGLPGLALAAEPEERGIMQRAPRPPGQSLFAQGMWQHILWVGLLMGLVCLATQAMAIEAGTTHWQTMVFTVLTLSQMGHVMAVRSEQDSLAAQGLRSNLPLVGAVGLTFAMQVAVIYVPALNAVFHTAPLSAAELGACLAASSIVFFAVELEKSFKRRGALRRRAIRGAAGPAA